MFYQAKDQRIDVQLIHSRDGIRWHRTAGRERVIPNGPEGAWDSGIIFTASHPVVLEDRILIYYFGIQGDHHGTRNATGKNRKSTTEAASESQHFAATVGSRSTCRSPAAM